ncbi:MAG TPA: hypothetical protein GX403_17365 [Rhodocyclaceae bacterium]|nr:hypothetical protein [Rhodocyclaceae bacterium]
MLTHRRTDTGVDPLQGSDDEATCAAMQPALPSGKNSFLFAVQQKIIACHNHAH